MPDHFYVYPEYLESASRSLGRRIRRASLGEVSVSDIVAAAQSLGFEAAPEPEKQYPRTFYRYAGRVKVSKKAGTTKGSFLKALAAELERTHPGPRKA
ncbi:MAG TPA: signal recognition particle subunit SRP19/SEC65 family protein [Thermoplasmata archaeon]|nr:signal recognition particle subunit SRP19/SEC65 family protein [Thermoplasmata archaeon]